MYRPETSRSRAAPQHWAMTGTVVLFVAMLAVCPTELSARSKAPALHKQIRNSTAAEVRASVAAGADTSQRDEITGLNALHLALSLNKREVALVLAGATADVNARTRDGVSSLIMAIDRGYDDVATVLLDRHAAVEYQSRGPSALASAVRTDNSILFERLVTQGANVHRRNNDDETALHVAANLGHSGMVERLLALGADINVATSDGRTPIHFALLNEQSAIAASLYDSGAAVTTARGEVGTFTTALVFQYAAERAYSKGDVALAKDQATEAQRAFTAMQAMSDSTADELSKKLHASYALNALSLAVAQTQANIQAQTSLSGTGSAFYTVGRTRSLADLRRSYRGIQELSKAGAARMDVVIRCLESPNAATAACFAATGSK